MTAHPAHAMNARDDAPDASDAPDTPDASAHVALSREQELEALRRVQSQAEQRIQLGLRLFRAAEKQAFSYQQLLERVKQEQKQLQEQVNQDVTASLRVYDQWVQELEDKFTQSLASLEERMDTLQRQWQQAQQRLESMMSRSEALVDHSRTLLQNTDQKLASLPRQAPEIRVIQEPPLSAAAAPAPVTQETANVAAPSIADILLQVKRRAAQLGASAQVQAAADTAHRELEPEPIEGEQAEPNADTLYRQVLQQMSARRSA